MEFTEVNIYFQDESRFGLFTRNGKMLTAKGVKPICPFHQVFKSTYLFGAFSPIDGDSFSLELPHCNANTFQVFINEFATHRPHEYKIVVLDNGAFHKAAHLQIPKNISLLFLPPYSPELNPAEKMWANYKRAFSNQLFKNLDDLSNFIQEHTQLLNADIIKSICAFSYIFSHSYWTT